MPSWPVRVGDGSCVQAGQLCAFTQTQVPSDTLGSENTDCLVFVVSLTEFWGTVEQRLGPRACVPSATCGADALGPVRTLTDEQGGV